jgi:hypothetical protein
MKKVFDEHYKEDFVKVSNFGDQNRTPFLHVNSFFHMPIFLGWSHGRLRRGTSALDL